MLDVNPAKQGVENPQRRRTEKRPFESWAELDAIAERLGPRFGPIVIFRRGRVAEVVASSGLQFGSNEQAAFQSNEPALPTALFSL